MFVTQMFASYHGHKGYTQSPTPNLEELVQQEAIMTNWIASQ
jgi:hypothetical protein